MEDDPEAQSPHQPSGPFSFSRLLAFASIACLLLVPFYLVGWPAIRIAAAAVVLLVPFYWRPRWLYVWILPLVWVLVAHGNFFHCGDEYGGFVIGSLAGMWVVTFLTVNSPAGMLPFVLAAGSITTAAAGAALDWLRMKWAVWFGLWLVASLLLYAAWFGSFPTTERALAKNGSYETYLLTSINFGLTTATCLALLGAALHRSIGSVRRRRSRSDPPAT